MSASHCAYCGAALASEEPVQDDSTPVLVSQPVMNDLFATVKEESASGPYTSSRAAHPFVQDREPVAPDETLNKPLYSVFDQPLTHQMGALRDEIMDKKVAVSQPSITPSEPLPSIKMPPLSGLRAQLSRFFPQNISSPGLEVLATSSLIIGMNLCLLGLLTLFFSKEGVLILSWHTHVVPWLLLLAAVCLVVGFRSFNNKTRSSP